MSGALVAGLADCEHLHLGAPLRVFGQGAQRLPPPDSCRVSGVDAATQEVTLTPHPDPSAHPLAYQRFQRAAQRQAGAAGDTAEEEPDEDEGGEQGCPS